MLSIAGVKELFFLVNIFSSFAISQDYCTASGKIKCWLSLGSVLSSGDHTGAEPIEVSYTCNNFLSEVDCYERSCYSKLITS